MYRQQEGREILGLAWAFDTLWGPGAGGGGGGGGVGGGGGGAWR